MSGLRTCATKHGGVVPGDVHTIPAAVVHLHHVPHMRFAAAVLGIAGVAVCQHAGNVQLIANHLKRAGVAVANGAVLACAALQCAQALMRLIANFQQIG